MWVVVPLGFWDGQNAEIVAGSGLVYAELVKDNIVFFHSKLSNVSYIKGFVGH